MIERESYYMAPDEDSFSKCDIMTENPPARPGTSGIRIIIPAVNCEHIHVQISNYYLHIGHHLHCNENPIYVFLFWKLRGLSPNFHIHVSLIDLYIPRIGPHISCRRIGRAGIFKKSMGARHRVGIGLLYRPARQHRLAEFIPWNRFRGPIHVQKYQLRSIVGTYKSLTDT